MKPEILNQSIQPEAELYKIDEYGKLEEALSFDEIKEGGYYLIHFPNNVATAYSLVRDPKRGLFVMKPKPGSPMGVYVNAIYENQHHMFMTHAAIIESVVIPQKIELVNPKGNLLELTCHLLANQGEQEDKPVKIRFCNREIAHSVRQEFWFFSGMGERPADLQVELIEHEEDFEEYSNEVEVGIYSRWPEDDLPAYKTPGSSAMDLKAYLPDAPMVIPAREWRLIPTGIHVAAPEDVDTQVRMRSGLAIKHGLSLLNGPGTIDSDYRGELGLIIMNNSSEDYTVEHGARMGQVIFLPLLKATWTRVEFIEDLGETERGEGGFGHTGVSDTSTTREGK